MLSFIISYKNGSASLSPIVASTRGFEVLVVSRFRKAMTEAGFTISGEDHAISPVMLGDAKAFITTNHGVNKEWVGSLVQSLGRAFTPNFYFFRSV